MVDNQNHQGVAALCEVGESHDEAFLFTLIDRLDQPALLLVLDGVTDPHNLGGCLRSAEAAGVNAVIAPKDKSASLTAVAGEVGSGAAEGLPFVPATNWARTRKRLRQGGDGEGAGSGT